MSSPVAVFAAEVVSLQTLRFAVLGLASGSLLALIGLSIVIVQRASGVLNFSTGALGGIAAFVFYGLRDDRKVPWALALVVAMTLGLLLGLATRGVLALARRASLVGQLIVTLGLMTAALGLIEIAWGTGSRQPRSILPTTGVSLGGGLTIPRDRLVILALVVVLAVVLRLVYSRTLFGLATAAVAENRRVASISGWSPGAIELVNFGLAGTLSAGAAILLAPIVSLNGAALAFTVLPALAAALAGRFSSFAVTVAAALATGVAQSELSLFQPDIAGALGWDEASLGGLPQAVPLLMIIGVTVATGRTRPARGEVLARLPLPGGGRVSWPVLVVGAVVGEVALIGLPRDWADALVITFATAILLLSVVVVAGYAGQLSLCQFALAGFGAWVAARLVSTTGMAFGPALVAGVVATVPVGLVVALPALRTRGVDLAVATLGLALLLSALVFGNGSLTGGFTGTPVTSPSLVGIELDPVARPARYGSFVLAVLVVAGIVVANVRRGRAGRRLLAVRSNERAAAALGVGVVGAKLYAFGLGAALAALSGILLAFRTPNVQFQQFNVLGSISAVVYAVLGGIGWASGTVLGALMADGAVMAKVTESVFRGVPGVNGWLLVVSGLGVVIVLIRSPDGAAARLARLARWRWPSWRPAARARRRPDPAPVADRPRRSPATVELRDVTVAFGGVLAVDQVSFTVRPGEVVGLIGPNGAGKTTLLDVITGFTPPSSGSVLLDGRSIDRWSPERRARHGMARSWQAVELFEEMTVRENLLVAADLQAAERYLVDLVRPGRAPASAAMRSVIDELELADHLDRRPSSLPQGTARLVGIARAIAAEPGLLLLDEPAAGLDGHESAEVGRVIRGLARSLGIGVLVVEHDVPLLLATCDRIVALDFGRKLADGTPQEVAEHPGVVRSYLGEPSPGDRVVVGAGEGGRREGRS